MISYDLVYYRIDMQREMDILK